MVAYSLHLHHFAPFSLWAASEATKKSCRQTHWSQKNKSKVFGADTASRGRCFQMRTWRHAVTDMKIRKYVSHSYRVLCSRRHGNSLPANQGSNWQRIAELLGPRHIMAMVYNVYNQAQKGSHSTSVETLYQHVDWSIWWCLVYNVLYIFRKVRSYCVAFYTCRQFAKLAIALFPWGIDDRLSNRTETKMSSTLAAACTKGLIRRHCFSRLTDVPKPTGVGRDFS